MCFLKETNLLRPLTDYSHCSASANVNIFITSTNFGYSCGLKVTEKFLNNYAIHF